MMPLVKFLRGSKRSNKENVPQPKSIAAVTEQSVYTGPSPYSVVTQPKKHKGPRSCPGAPMDDVRIRSRELPFSDRHSQLNSSARYENLPRPRIESFDGGNYRFSQEPQRRIRDERNYYNQRHNYESGESDDDEYRIVDLEAQVSDLKVEIKKSRERCREYKRRMEEAYDEATHYRRNFERQYHSYEKLRKTLDLERKQRTIAEYKNEKLTKELQLANKRIMDLEEKLTFEEHTVDHSIHENTADGAGEALCDQHDTCSRDMVNSDTPSVSMFTDGNIDQEKDEVRIFHPQDSDEGDLYENADTPEVEVERSMRSSPLELPLACSPPLFSAATSGKIGRSLSDTDLQSLASAVEEQQLATKTSTLDRTPIFKNNYKLKDNVRHPVPDSPQFSTSDEESDDHAFQQQQYAKQLKKIGDAVKYKPPRKQIEEKYYRRFGKSERAAMEELKFLDDMSSDASGLLSSPDFVQATRLYK